MKELKLLVNEHWAYIEKLLKAHGEDEATIKKIKYHYKTAFRHGWKHHKQISNPFLNCLL